MKALSTMVALLIMMTMLFSGCGADSQNNGNQDAVQNQGNQPNGEGAFPNGRGQFQQADLAGEIVSVSGNSVSIKVIDMSGMFGRGRRGQNGAENQPTDGNSGNALAQSGNNDTPQGSRPQGQSQPEGSRPEGSRPAGGWQGQGQPELKYTGETKTVTIPEDVSITTFGRGSNGNQQNTVAVSELKQGEILQLWYADKEKGTISRASILSFRGNNAPSNDAAANPTVQ